jgi:hypothetical protein
MMIARGFTLVIDRNKVAGFSMTRTEFLLQYAWVLPASFLIVLVFAIAAAALSPSWRKAIMKRLKNAPSSGPNSIPVLLCTSVAFISLFSACFYGLLIAAKQMNLDLGASSVGGIAFLITVATFIGVSRLFKLDIG